MNYIELLKSLGPFINKGFDDYFIITLMVIESICLLLILPAIYCGFKEFKETKKVKALFTFIGYTLVAIVCGCTIYGLESTQAQLVPELKEVKIDNKENIEFYKTIIRSPYYQKLDDNDKNAVYAAIFNGIICGDDGCLNNVGEPLLVHKNFALTYAIQKLFSYNNTKINKDFGKTISLNDVVYNDYEKLAYNGVSFEYEEAFNKFLEEHPKADEAIENAKQKYKRLRETYKTEWQ